MLWTRRLLSALFLSVLAAACDGDSTGPSGPRAVRVGEGNNQTGAVGTSLAAPLRVVVLGPGERPMPGVTVHWRAVAGGGLVTPDSSVTDQAGVAAASLTVGSVPGVNLVTASVGALPPVTFVASSVEPCRYNLPAAIGVTLGGTLGDSDCRLSSGAFADFYSFNVPAQRAVQFGQASTSYDTYMSMYDPAGRLVAVNDDFGGTLNSGFRVLLRPGEYVVRASSLSSGRTGPYTLTSQLLPEDNSGCVEFWVTRGISTAQRLTAGDCGAPAYFDPYSLYLVQGETVTVSQSSPVFDSFLALQRSGSVVASDDNGGGGLNARLTYTAPATGLYVVLARTRAGSSPALGDYTLAIQ